MTHHSALLFSVVTGSSEPIYRQLIDQIRRMVAGGQLAAGDAMPSVREIAQALALNPMTVSKSYSLLELEGVLVRQRGRGMLVADGPRRATDQRAELLRPILLRAAQEARQLELDPDTVLSLLNQILRETP